MTNYVVTVLDTTQVQSYIFKSNRLRENIGASHLVAKATDAWITDNWVIEALNQLPGEVYIPPIPNPTKADQGKRIEQNNLTAELVYAGGGNTVLLFASLDHAIEFTKILSKRLLQDAPGLNIVAAHGVFDWDESGSLKHRIAHLIEYDIERQKRESAPSSPLLGLSVTAECSSTGQTAVDMSHNYGVPKSESYPISREITAKLNAVEAANTELKIIFQQTPTRYRFPYELDSLGRSEGENSYIAIVHADGNSMGDRFQHCGDGLANRAYISAIRHLSWSVNEAGRNALKTIYQTLIASIDDDGKVMGDFSLKEGKNGEPFLPFRPLVYGGDDVTFVCDGRLGLSLATLYLEAFENQPASDGKPLTACAGISIVKTHYPFARAYALSEALCKEAKDFMREDKKGGDSFSALDWHIASSGLLGSIGEIREREYRVKINDSLDNFLTMRPIRLQAAPKQWRNWIELVRVINEFRTNQTWKDSRNKVIALREVLRQGPLATEQWLLINGLDKLPGYTQIFELQKRGWLDTRCGYFDAIEAMEFYLPLRTNS